MKELTERQKEILSFVIKHIGIHSYPPTIREIADNFRISIKGAHDHITALIKKGVLKHDGKRSRALEVVKNEEDDMENCVKIPVLGTVAAGRPILSEENWDGFVPMHRSMLKKNKEYFALKVRGDSMTGAGIMDGDTAIIEQQNIVRNGEIAVAVVEEAITLKRFFRETSRIRLQAENADYKPIYCQDVRIIGRLSGIVRSY
ncbi:MAG TPA: repressor LexA [Treponema sp.]|nr:repressor LexA [Treponema sp.]